MLSPVLQGPAREDGGYTALTAQPCNMTKLCPFRGGVGVKADLLMLYI